MLLFKIQVELKHHVSPLALYAFKIYPEWPRLFKYMHKLLAALSLEIKAAFCGNILYLTYLR